MNIRKIQSKAYLSILLLLLPLLASAQVKIDSIWYNLDTESMTAEVIKNPLGFGYYLSSVTIPSTVTHEDVLYNVTRIGNNAFKSGVILTSITIPACVTSIGDEAFYECSNLVDVSFSEGVTSIGKNAFSQCSSLTEITIPASVMNIGFGAFSYCSGLTSISVDERNTAYDSRENCNAIIKTSNNSLIAGCSTTTIPESVTSIGGVAFANFTNITEITIPANVTSIGPSAFYNCKNLSEITIPANVESIGRSAFEGTPWLNNQSEGIVYVGKTLYAYKGSMPEKTSIDVREGTKSITDKAFYEQENLSSITIPASVTKIGDGAFYKCNSLTSITIPASVTEIGDEAFNACSGLAAINVAEGNIVYDSRGGCNAIIETSTNALLLGCSATIIPEDVESIGRSAFFGCSGLSEITIPASVTSIGEHAFQNCRYLSSVAIPEGVDSIGDLAFSSCERLTSINLPANIKSIGNSAFSSCGSLTSIVIPEGLSHITDGMFYGCANLNEIIIPEGVKSIGWNAFRECVSLREIIIPSSVTSIGNEAFYGCSSLTNINIPKGVKTIGTETFRGCSNLTSIILPEGMTSIGESALYGCISLTEITIPYGVTSIGESAFGFCNNLTTITIPASVTNIASFAFYGCEQLREVYCHAEELPSMGSVVFYLKAIDSTTLHVPTSALETYKMTAPWSSFGNIVAIEEPKPYLVTEGKEWANRYFVAQETHDVIYKLSGDTIINGYTYKKEWQTGWNDPSQIELTQGFIREEDGKVYRKEYDNEEYLWFDYNANVGDTIFYEHSFVKVVGHSDTTITCNGVSRTYKGVDVQVGIYDANIGTPDSFDNYEYYLIPGYIETFYEELGLFTNGDIVRSPSFYKTGQIGYLLYVKQDDTMLYQIQSENKIFSQDMKWYGSIIVYYWGRPSIYNNLTYHIGADTITDRGFGQNLYRNDEYWGTLITMGEQVWLYPSEAFYKESWYADETEEPFLLYDFSLQLNDTLYYTFNTLGFSREKPKDDNFEYMVVKNVYHTYGRKIIEFDQGCRWAEGIGCLGASILNLWRPMTTNGDGVMESIDRVEENGQVIYSNGEFVNPDIESWLKAGMTWTENKQYAKDGEIVSRKITISEGDTPGFYNVSSTDSIYKLPFGRLQVTNNKVYGHGLGDVFLLYDFSLKVGDKIYLLKYYCYGLDKCTYEYDQCYVAKVDTAVYNGVPRKRITLSGDREDVWVEGIGSLTRVFPIDGVIDYDFYSENAIFSEVAECSHNGELLYRKNDFEITRPLTQHGYGLYHGMYDNTFLYAYTMDEAVGVTDSTDFARWNDREVIRIDVDTIGPNAFSGATFRQGQIICFSDRLNTICKDAFAGINIVKRTSQEAPQISDDLTLVFEGTNPPGIDKNNILDYSDSTCHINFVVPDMATYIAEDNQWTYTTLMTIDDFIKGYVSSENEVTVTDPTEVTITDVEEGELSGGVENSSLVVVVEARPRKDIPVRIGDGENKDIYSRAPAWQRYTVELKVTDSSEALLYEGAMACSASDVCVFDVTLPCRPDDDVIYLHSRSIDMFDRATEWATRAVTLTRIEDVKTLDSDTYYDLQGRKVAHPTRGVYIKNGRKVIVK